MCFSIKDDELQKYGIWNGFSNSVKKNLKTKIKPYGEEATEFHDKEMPKVGANYISININ